jgi:hypothetical protein
MPLDFLETSFTNLYDVRGQGCMLEFHDTQKVVSILDSGKDLIILGLLLIWSTTTVFGSCVKF